VRFSQVVTACGIIYSDLPWFGGVIRFFKNHAPNRVLEPWEEMEVLGGYKNALKQTSCVGRFRAVKQQAWRNIHQRDRNFPRLVCFTVEPQRIELWSREDNAVPSTCLVDIDCREKQGYQHPKPLLSYCVLTALSNIARSSSALRHRWPAPAKRQCWAMMAFPILSGRG